MNHCKWIIVVKHGQYSYVDGAQGQTHKDKTQNTKIMQNRKLNEQNILNKSFKIKYMSSRGGGSDFYFFIYTVFHHKLFCNS